MDSKPPARMPLIPISRGVARSLAAVAALALLVLAVWGLPTELLAQAAQSAPEPPREMRQFWHVFIAYAIAWLLVFVWLLTILRRIRRVDERLTKLEEKK